MFDHAWIAAHLPHHGSMCLLDEVVSWNENEIICRAGSHRLADNPLYADGKLGVMNGIEYAAQSMAIHGALLAGSDKTASVGFLASVRDVQWHRAHLDDMDGDLAVCASRLFGNNVNILYQFALYADDVVLLSGRASVILDAEN